MPEPLPQPSESELTLFLARLGRGDETADPELMQHVYDQLRATAAAYMHKQGDGHSLQPTGLVHEAFLKLFHGQSVNWNDRTHFFALAANVMRNILVDHARRKFAQGGQRSACLIDGIAAKDEAEAIDLIELDSALQELAEQDEREGRVVELRYFGGLTIAETAKVLQVSTPTVERDWAMARAWLGKRLGLGEER
jgi:RNA polymerase sigma-70 factor (ECF subfamily)